MFLQRIWEDLKCGKNLDIVAVIITSIIFIFLDIVGVVPSSWVTSLNLSVLALISLSLLVNRYQMKTIVQITSEQHERLLKEFDDDDIIRDIRDAEELMVIGVDLNMVLEKHHVLMLEKLQEGKTVKLLFVNPDSSACEAAAARNFVDKTHEEQRVQILQSIQKCKTLKQTTGGNLEIRVANHPHQFGAYNMRTKDGEGTIYLWYYTFKSTDENRPKMIIPSTDEWHKLYKEQIDSKWENATPYSI